MHHSLFVFIFSFNNFEYICCIVEKFNIFPNFIPIKDDYPPMAIHVKDH